MTEVSSAAGPPAARLVDAVSQIGTNVTDSTYRRIVVAHRGGPEVLEVQQDELPRPAPGEVRIRTEAAGVSGLDRMLRSRSFPGFPKVPFTPGTDVVGVIDEVGDEVTAFAPGKRVGALLGFNGGYAEAVCVAAADAVAVPDGVDPAAAVCVIANHVTAYSVMHHVAKVKSGERVLIQGAAGGVGTALLDVGRLAGLEMYGTASDYNHDLISSYGATPIDYRSDDFVARIRALTGDGVDVVFDPIGGARQLWRSYRTLRKGGRLVWFGVAASAQHGARVIPASLVARTAIALIPDGKRAPLTPDIMKDNERYRRTLGDVFDLLAAGKIEPLIAARIPLAEAARAHEVLERGGYAGRVILVVED